MKITDFIKRQEIFEDFSSGKNEIRLWRNLWDAVVDANPYWAKELVLKYRLSQEDIDNPKNIHPDRQVEISTLLQTYLSQITPDVDYGMGAEKNN